MILVLTILLSGYGFSYDGCHEDKHYFQVNTPKADYGWVMSESELYCDTIYQKD